MRHFDELILDGGRLFHAVVLRRKRRRADYHVAHADFTAAVALAMVSRETLHNHSGELVFPVQENVFVGNENVVEHD